MVLLALLIACSSDPGAPAVGACEAVPMLSAEQAGQDALAPHITIAEQELLMVQPPTLGMQKVGSEGFAKLRAATKCEVVSTKSGKEGTTVTLKRTGPGVNADGSIGAEKTDELEFLVVETDAGLRAQTGLQAAVDLRAQIVEAQTKLRPKRVAELWQSMGNKYPDPSVAVDSAAAQLTLQKAVMMAKVVANYDKPYIAKKEGEVNSAVAIVSNTADRAIVDANVTFRFTVKGKKEPHLEKVKTGPIEAGKEISIMAPIPIGVTGGVTVTLEDLTL